MVIIINPVLEEYKFSRDYFGENEDLKLRELGYFLKPKPDTPGWREFFRDNKETPIESGGKLFRFWALLDLYKLMALIPGIEREFLPEGMTLKDLPSLDRVLDSMGFQKVEE